MFHFEPPLTTSGNLSTSRGFGIRPSSSASKRPGSAAVRRSSSSKKTDPAGLSPRHIRCHTSSRENANDSNQRRKENLQSIRTKASRSPEKTASRRAVFLGSFDPYCVATVITEAKEVINSNQNLDVILTGRWTNFSLATSRTNQVGSILSHSEAALAAGASTLRTIMEAAGVNMSNVAFYHGGFAKSFSTVPFVEYEELLLKPDGSVCNSQLFSEIVGDLAALDGAARAESRLHTCASRCAAPVTLETMETLATRWASEPTIDFQVAGPFTALAKLIELCPALKTKRGTLVAIACTWRDRTQLVANHNISVDPKAFEVVVCKEPSPLSRVDVTLIPTDPFLPGASWHSWRAPELAASEVMSQFASLWVENLPAEAASLGSDADVNEAYQLQAVQIYSEADQFHFKPSADNNSSRLFVYTRKLGQSSNLVSHVAVDSRNSGHDSSEVIHLSEKSSLNSSSSLVSVRRKGGGFETVHIPIIDTDAIYSELDQLRRSLDLSNSESFKKSSEIVDLKSQLESLTQESNLSQTASWSRQLELSASIETLVGTKSNLELQLAKESAEKQGLIDDLVSKLKNMTQSRDEAVLSAQSANLQWKTLLSAEQANTQQLQLEIASTTANFHSEKLEFQQMLETKEKLAKEIELKASSSESALQSQIAVLQFERDQLLGQIQQVRAESTIASQKADAAFSNLQAAFSKMTTERISSEDALKAQVIQLQSDKKALEARVEVAVNAHGTVVSESSNKLRSIAEECAALKSQKAELESSFYSKNEQSLVQFKSFEEKFAAKDRECVELSKQITELATRHQLLLDESSTFKGSAETQIKTLVESSETARVIFEKLKSESSAEIEKLTAQLQESLSVHLRFTQDASEREKVFREQLESELNSRSQLTATYAIEAANESIVIDNLQSQVRKLENDIAAGKISFSELESFLRLQIGVAQEQRKEVENRLEALLVQNKLDEEIRAKNEERIRLLSIQASEERDKLLKIRIQREEEERLCLLRIEEERIRLLLEEESRMAAFRSQEEKKRRAREEEVALNLRRAEEDRLALIREEQQHARRLNDLAQVSILSPLTTAVSPTGPGKKTLGCELSSSTAERCLSVSKVDEIGPARSAGILEGDKLLKINGSLVSSLLDFRSIWSTTAVGDLLRIELLRDDQALTVAVVVG